MVLQASELEMSHIERTSPFAITFALITLGIIVNGWAHCPVMSQLEVGVY